MENDTNELLRTLLVAQVLTLAKTIEISKNMGDSRHSSTDHFVGDAIREIQRDRASILQRLSNTR
ncbi:hypothetical protein [Propionivibrio dicarboxylicus]|uniref:Uncharacterized protein n=1 Tax=Propionivibrio dicarboxylicus TaxID=83767 RepID=A0A1G8L8H2_9RHOO|nr:hypothetical protein [Propionivibrio dicarboxylicus]SDI52044.1 hypothetical protein SAMN05660652_03573 [Propionivibrio dicarboxylicus]